MSLRVIALTEVLAYWTPGDEGTWQEEFDFLRCEHAARLDMMANLVQHHGLEFFDVPIQLGNDGRCWDGHHRLCVADMLGIEWVPADLVGL